MEQIFEEDIQEDLEITAMWVEDDTLIATMVSQCINDFSEVDDGTKASRDAAEIARNSITEGTRYGHIR